MNNVISQMLSKYEIKNTHDEVNALKEVIQEIVLSGLARGNFFDFAEDFVFPLYYRKAALRSYCNRTFL